MARYDEPTGKQLKFTDPVYGMLDAEDVMANPEKYVLMVRTVHAKVDRKLEAREDRRYMPKEQESVFVKKGWAPVDLNPVEKANAAPSPIKAKASK